VLARLAEIPGVEESRVEHSGRRFLLTLGPGADEPSVARSALRVLGEGSAILDRDAESAMLDSRRRGDPWLDAGGVIALSREEAQILGARFAEEAANALALPVEKRRKLAAVVEREIAAAFERFHGRSDALQAFVAEREAIAARVLESSRAFLSEPEIEALRSFSEQTDREEDVSECEPPPSADE
jgi:hypothetical protein